MIPARRLFVGLGVAALLVAVSVVVPWMAAAGAALDAALLLLALWDARLAHAAPLEARRSWPSLLAQGDPAELVITLFNPGGRPLRLQVRDGLHPALAEAPARRALELPPAGTARWRLRLVPRRRGEHRLLPLTVRVLGPMGLAWAQRTELAGEVQRVFPRIRWGGEVGRLLRLAQRHQLGQLPWRREAAVGEPYALREYLPGEPARRIHWKATARHARPIVREDTWERGNSVLILLDAGRAMAAPAGPLRSKLDEALGAALVITRVAAARQDRVTILAFSDKVERVVTVRPGQAGVKAAYRRLFDLEARLAEPAFGLAADRLLELERRQGIVLLLTSMADLAAVEHLSDVLARLRRRHRVVLVNLEDPELERLALGAPATEEEAFAKASALEILLTNRRAARTLRARGIRVVSTPAPLLAAAAVSGYLEMVLGMAPGRNTGRRLPVRAC